MKKYGPGPTIIWEEGDRVGRVELSGDRLLGTVVGSVNTEIRPGVRRDMYTVRWDGSDSDNYGIHWWALEEESHVPSGKTKASA